MVIKDHNPKFMKGSDIEKYLDEKRSREFLNVLTSSGKSRIPHDFPLLQYYLDENNVYPSILDFTEATVDHSQFTEKISKNISEVLFEKRTYDDFSSPDYISLQYLKLRKGYIAEISVSFNRMEAFSLEDRERLRKSSVHSSALISSILLYCPPIGCSIKNSSFEEEFVSTVKSCIIEQDSKISSVGMICIDDGECYIRDFFIEKDYSIKDADLHYGKGFNEFHRKLIGKFKGNTKGLVLLHGSPGTGKTYYIRSLISELLTMKKYVIYVSPAAIESMMDPSTMSFLASTAMDKAAEGISCVLLIEDAEPLLASRKTENRTNGITNLLNATDGILNDVLSFQVIATFNIELSNIDDALLRPERLIARKEFKKLKKEDAQTLIKKLDVDMIAESDMSLAEIYSHSKANEILVHEYNHELKKIGF